MESESNFSSAGAKMSTPRTNTLIAVVVLLALLALVSGASALTNVSGLIRAQQFAASGTFPGGNGGNFRGGNGGNFQGGNGGNFQGDNGGNLPGGNGGNFQGGNGGNFPGGNGGNFQGGTGRAQGRGGALFTTNGIFRALGLNFQSIGYINLGIAVLGIILLLVCAFGVWSQKRWALNLTVVVTAVYLLGALGSLFFGAGRSDMVRTGLDLLSFGGMIALLILAFWPSTRSAVS
jgi:hypothetical protein